MVERCFSAIAASSEAALALVSFGFVLVIGVTWRYCTYSIR
jgi:hypothetical protein